MYSHCVLPPDTTTPFELYVCSVSLDCHFAAPLEIRNTPDVKSLWTASFIVGDQKSSNPTLFKEWRSIAAGQLVSLRSLTFDHPISYQSSLMTTDPLSSPEVVVQLIQDFQMADYAGLSTAMMFIWDSGGLTDRIFHRMTPLVFGFYWPSDHT